MCHLDSKYSITQSRQPWCGVNINKYMYTYLYISLEDNILMINN
jgi:hypothetical protein